MDLRTSRLLDRATNDDVSLDDREALQLSELTPQERERLLTAAAARRDRHYGRRITFSPKVFLPLTNLCRNRCDYCAFRRAPGEDDARTMHPDEVRQVLTAGREAGCSEALFCLGDTPESSFPTYRQTLAAWGFSSTVDYLQAAGRWALQAGLLPHTNAGLLEPAAMQRLKQVNVSLGLMLETASTRLCEPGMPHHRAPDKQPARRLAMINAAGALDIPFTTGILVGIGETRRERIESLLAIRHLARRHSHIQEVIVQNFRAHADTKMAHAPEPETVEIAETVAIARLVLDPEVSVQAPPNLNPGALGELLGAGINDLGGISPITPDYINLSYRWPELDTLHDILGAAGFTLSPRLSIYPRFLKRPGWLHPALHDAVLQAQARLDAEPRFFPPALRSSATTG